MFEQERYIESTIETFKSELRNILPDVDFPVGIPNVGDERFTLDKPVVSVRYRSSANIDGHLGKNTGRGTKVKRKLLNLFVLVITTGNNEAILQRDRICQKIENHFSDESVYQRLYSQGFSGSEARFGNSYRVREGVHLARVEIFTEVKFIN